ncbi:FG-GAP-like repeat-containing protein [Actinokineospora auranticolor]|uniref:FG-GAP-like repeat-containing protein n=1 Tax=Actinokineospora auranticolor TaxID=155976 RepID=UPI0015E49679|nr:FG-GAP-like repeat-containing protein [Actinokineospora auranticolor]
MFGRLGVLACALSTAVVVLPVVPAAAQRSSQPVVAVTEAATESAARVAARVSGRRVEVLDQRSESAQVFVNPSGSLTLEQTGKPVRTRKNGAWVDIDTSLRLDGGRVVAGATAVDVSFSPGGSSPLMAFSRNGKRMALSWPGVLPAPVLSGDTATYPEVLKGVDLQLRAEAGGARLLVVVKDREAAANPELAELRYRYSVSGLRLRQEGGSGAVSAVDDSGAVVFAAGTPVMWDSSDAQPAARRAQVSQEDGPSRKEAAMPVRLDRAELAVVPDAELLSAPDTVYPVSIDPWFTADTWAWTYVNRKFPNQSYWSSGREVGTNSGYESTDGTTQRAYFRMGTSAVNGKDIISATFRANMYHSWSCAKTETQLWAGGDIGPGTTWNNQPWRRYITSVTAAKKSGGTGDCAPGIVEFDAKSAVVEAAANNYANTVLSLQAPVDRENANDTQSWKKFSSDPKLVIEYNSTPDTPSALYADINLPCASGVNRPVTNTSPTLFATGTDPDSANVQLQFEWAKLDGTAVGGYTTPALASGTRFSAVIPTSSLADGVAYKWRVRGADSRVSGPWSGYCEFGYDTTRPTAVPGVSSSSFPENDLGIAAGSRGEFTFTSADPDVYGYRYGLTENTTYFVAAGPGTGRPATVPVVAPSSTLLTLYVYSIDKAGNRSDTYRAYPFYPDEPASTSHVKHDVNGDGLADVAAMRQLDSDESDFLSFTSSGTGLYPMTQSWYSGPNTAFLPDRTKVLEGDANGDGRSDLLVLRDDGGYRVTLWVFYGNGLGYTAPSAPAWDSGPNGWDLNRVKATIGDVNGDGKDDVIAFYNYFNATFSIFTLLSTATGAQAPTTWWNTPPGSAEWANLSVISGDFNGDGKDDVGCTYDYGNAQTRLWYQYSTGTAFGGGVMAWDSGVNNWSMGRGKYVVTDANGDGKDDLVAFYNYYNATFSVFTFKSTATGALAPTVWWNNPPGNAEWTNMTPFAGDVDGDGDGDIGFAYQYANRRTALWLNYSTGSAYGAPLEKWNSGDNGLDSTRTRYF